MGTQSQITQKLLVRYEFRNNMVLSVFENYSKYPSDFE